MLVRAVKADPTDEQVLNRLVRVELKLQGVAELPEAESEAILVAVEALLSDLPGNLLLICERGGRLAMLGREDEAREAWEQALAQDPDNSKVLANLAVLDSRKDDYPQAKAMLVRAVKADPTDEQVLNRLVEVELKLQGVAELPTSSPERDDVLLAVYKSLRNKFPDNWFLLAGSSVALSRLSRFAEKAGHQFEARRHFREASEILKRLLQERPKDLKAYGYVLGETYRMSAGASFRKTLGAVVGGIRRVVNRDDTRPRDLYNLACAFALAGDRGGMLWALRVTINFEEKYRKEAREDDDFRWFWNDYDFQALTSP